jgi:hypothetical protein
MVVGGTLSVTKRGEKKTLCLLGKMFESGFPDASGREEGLMSGLAPGLGPVSGYPWPITRAHDRITIGGGMVLLFVLRWLLVVLSVSLIT